MGICSSQGKQRNLTQTQTMASVKDAIQATGQPILKQNTILGHVYYTSLEPEPPKEYDTNNPHRQYNVLINGTHFGVVNSLEPSINR